MLFHCIWALITHGVWTKSMAPVWRGRDPQQRSASLTKSCLPHDHHIPPRKVQLCWQGTNGGVPIWNKFLKHLLGCWSSSCWSLSLSVCKHLCDCFFFKKNVFNWCQTIHPTTRLTLYSLGSYPSPSPAGRAWRLFIPRLSFPLSFMSQNVKGCKFNIDFIK